MSCVLHSIDHVFVPLEAPEPAFALLTEQLGLPVAWHFGSYGSFRSCGVGLGNANLELVASDPRLGPPFRAQQPARVQGIVFDPYGAIGGQWLAALDARGIDHGEPSDDSPEFTTVELRGLMDERTMTLACQYHAPAVQDAAARMAALTAVNGGRLGLRRLAEVVVATTDLMGASKRWQRLFDPLRPEKLGYWDCGSGSPALRLVEGPEDCVLGLVLEVASVTQASRVFDGLDISALRDLRVEFTAE